MQNRKGIIEVIMGYRWHDRRDKLSDATMKNVLALELEQNDWLREAKTRGFRMGDSAVKGAKHGRLEANQG